MKNIRLILIIFSLLTSFVTNAQNEVWFEADPYKSTEVWGDKVGDYVKVDITCSAPSVNEALLKARKIALYNYIFVGFDADGKASGIAKLAESSIYEQDRNFFISFINEEAKGLRFAEGKINTSKPGGEVKDGKKKLMKVTTTVTLKIPEIRKDLEAQGKIKSMASLKESLGDITVVIRPNDAWLKRLGGYKEIDNQGRPQIIRDYSKISLDKYYNDIVGAIRNNLGSGFKIDDINAQLSAANNEVMTDKLSSDAELQESPEDILARTLQADIYLEVSFEQAKISGGVETQFSLLFTGIDPYTNSSSDMAGQTIRKTTAGDNFGALLDAALKSSCNDFQSKALSFLIARDEKGIPGKILFKISDGVDLTFSKKLTVGGDKLAFSELVDEAVEQLSIRSSPFGMQTSTRREYDVFIPSKTKNRKGKEIPNNYEKFSKQVESYITDNLKSVEAIVKPLGAGKVIVIFTPAE
jgi:hypothetical protein